MTKRQRKKLSPNCRVVTVVLDGDAHEIVAKRKTDYFNETKKCLAWDRAILKILEGK